MKFCKDCKHKTTQGISSVCRRSGVKDMVTGDMNFYRCHIVREWETHCGKEGKWWEPTLSKSIWQQIREWWSK